MRIAAFVAVGLVCLTGFLHAQSDDDEDEMDYYPLVPTGNSMRFGLRYVGGPKVAFHNVGGVKADQTAQPESAVLVTRVYDDGTVSPDARTDAVGHPANDGQTNTWNANLASQITADGNVAYHIYSTLPMADGQTIRARNSLAEGWELQMGHSLGKIARKVDVSLVAGFTFSTFNSKRTSGVQSQLMTVTDVFSLNGQAVPTSFPVTMPSAGTQYVYDSNGQIVYTPAGSPKTTSGDQSLLLAVNPTRTISSTNPDGTPTTTEVQGIWQIKGAYYTFRLGPVFQLPLSERLKLSFGLGGAAVFAGSTYKSNETIVVEDLSTTVFDYEEKTHSVLLPAFYVDADAEFWLTERTGFYLGATYQKCQSFDQTLAGRSATIDLGSTSGITSGLTLRF
jgi:cell division septation protein DedD